MNIFTPARIPFLLLLFYLSAAGLNIARAQDTTAVKNVGKSASDQNRQEISTCAENLKSAETSFSKGQVEIIPGLLSGCLKSGFTKVEALTAYKLLIQVLLFNDRHREADSSMLAFLRVNPEYQLSQTDHSSFVYLFNSFSVKPVLLLSVRAGLNVPYLTFVREHQTSGIQGKTTYKSDASNIFLSLDGKFRLSKRLEAGFGIGYSQLKFTNTVAYYNFATIDYAETQHRIEIPVYMVCNLNSFGKFTPYFRVGAGAALNLSVSAEASLSTSDNAYGRTGGTIDVTDSRVPVDLFGQLGVGIKYKIPRGFLFIEARTNIGILQQNNPGGKNSDLLENYYLWSSPSFNMNTFNLSLGYTFIFYKPSKKHAE